MGLDARVTPVSPGCRTTRNDEIVVITRQVSPLAQRLVGQRIGPERRPNDRAGLADGDVAFWYILIAPEDVVCEDDEITPENVQQFPHERCQLST